MIDLHGTDVTAIERIELFERDELTTDLICCEIITAAQSLLFHEEWSGWPDLITRLEGLDGFRKDWSSQISQPSFEECRFVAFEKATS